MEPPFGQNHGYFDRPRGNGHRGSSHRRPWHPRGHPGFDPRRNFSDVRGPVSNFQVPNYAALPENSFPSGPGPGPPQNLEPHKAQWSGAFYPSMDHQPMPGFDPRSVNWRDRQSPASFALGPPPDHAQFCSPMAPVYAFPPPFGTAPPAFPPNSQSFPRFRGSGRPRYFKGSGRDWNNGGGNRNSHGEPRGNAGDSQNGNEGRHNREKVREPRSWTPRGRNETHKSHDGRDKGQREFRSRPPQAAAHQGESAEEPAAADGPTREGMDDLGLDPKIVEENRNRKPNPNKYAGASADDDGTQRDQLTEDLFHGTYECMVCCERIRPTHDVWSCQNCYHIFHLRCIRRWVQSSTAAGKDEGWRCPGCQNVTEQFLNVYLCFCGKMRQPEWNRHDTPHSCGEQCGKKRLQHNCVHPCNILCHPGPCPPCGVYVDRHCSCGKETKKVRCAQTKSFSCGQICEQLLNCGSHVCQLNCHTNVCDPCSVQLQRHCHCGKQSEETLCTKETAASAGYSCGSKCGILLDCGNHPCERLCHEGECDKCQLSPDVVTHCPCGQTPLSVILEAEQMRKACTDPIPVCDKKCDKTLDCGPEDDHHVCQSDCHPGPCPPCTLESTRKCRCGFLKKDIPCSEIESNLTVICEKRCNKKKHCGRHKCSQFCCTDATHRCTLVCGRKLSCGLHQCDELCHLGNCPVCWNTSFQELTCHCGSAVLYPPIPCGTRPPECSKPCTRRHNCDHPIKHNCHSEANCPPCTSLTSKWCYGEHELRTCIPCYQTNVCCGLPCSKPLPCGQHKCIQTCHEGSCISEGFKCTQPCTKQRPQCSHPCGTPCHEGECPPQMCKATVSVTCQCGNRSGTMPCAENLLAYQRLMSSVLASKHHATDQGQTLDITDVMKDGGLKKNCTLDCNEDCTLIERNRRLALALQIRNPELTCKLKPPVYSDFLKEQMRQNGAFVTSVYNKLTELVQSAKQSKQKSRSHAFPTMKSDHRHIIHELAELFGCETQSYDEEPKKNVVATAFRDKSWLPSTSIMAVIQKELGATRQAGKAPPPVPHSHWNSTPQSRSSSTTSATTLVGNNNTHSKQESATPIDYFDYTD